MQTAELWINNKFVKVDRKTGLPLIQTTSSEVVEPISNKVDIPVNITLNTKEEIRKPEEDIKPDKPKYGKKGV